MPRTPMGDRSIENVLASSQVVRIAFQDDAATYLIPLGYVWVDGALYGATDPGRKTRLAEANPAVGFQVDTSAETGLFAWESVTGTGRFEIVGDGEEQQRALVALQQSIAGAPDWWWAEQAARMAAGELLVWRLRPDKMTGARYAPSTRSDEND